MVARERQDDVDLSEEQSFVQSFGGQ